MSFWQDDEFDQLSEQKDFINSKSQTPVSYGQQDDESSQAEDSLEVYEPQQKTKIQDVKEVKIYKDHQQQQQKPQEQQKADSLKRQNSNQDNILSGAKRLKPSKQTGQALDLSKNVGDLMSLNEKLKQQQQQFLQEQNKQEESTIVEEFEDQSSTSEENFITEEINQPKIILKLQSKRQQELKIEIGIKNPFKTLVELYQEKALTQNIIQQDQTGKIQLRFDGDILQENQTAQQLGMEDNDVIDVIIKS